MLWNTVLSRSSSKWSWRTQQLSSTVLFIVGTCKASRFYSNSNRRPDSNSIRKWRSDSKIRHAVCRHITNYARSLFNKDINLCAVCSWDLCLQLHFTCRPSCTAVARAHTQLPHDNRHWTCKRLPPDSVRDSIRIRIVATYSIRDSIRTEISDSQVSNL